MKSVFALVVAFVAFESAQARDVFVPAELTAVEIIQQIDYRKIDPNFALAIEGELSAALDAKEAEIMIEFTGKVTSDTAERILGFPAKASATGSTVATAKTTLGNILKASSEPRVKRIVASKRLSPNPAVSIRHGR